MYKCYNTVSGLWFVKGKGFTGYCGEASILESCEKAMVCKIYENVAWIKL